MAKKGMNKEDVYKHLEKQEGNIDNTKRWGVVHRRWNSDPYQRAAHLNKVMRRGKNLLSGQTKESVREAMHDEYSKYVQKDCEVLESGNLDCLCNFNNFRFDGDSFGFSREDVKLLDKLCHSLKTTKIKDGCYHRSGEDYSKRIASGFLSELYKNKAKVTSETVKGIFESDTFLDAASENPEAMSALVGFVGKIKGKAERRKLVDKLLKQGDSLKSNDLYKAAVFGGIPKKEMTGIFEDLLEKLDKGKIDLKELSERRNRAARWGEMRYMPIVEPGSLNIYKKLGILETAHKLGIKLPKHDAYLRTLLDDAQEIYDPNVGDRWSREAIKDISRIASKIEGDSLPKTPGLVLRKPKMGGGTEIILNGNLAGIFDINEIDEKKGANSKMVTWTTYEQIDRDITGSQNRANVMVFKDGWKRPKRIWEMHKWEREGYFRVGAPQITQDGKIKIHYQDNSEEKDVIIDPDKS